MFRIKCWDAGCLFVPVLCVQWRSPVVQCMYYRWSVKPVLEINVHLFLLRPWRQTREWLDGGEFLASRPGRFTQAEISSSKQDVGSGVGPREGLNDEEKVMSLLSTVIGSKFLGLSVSSVVSMQGTQSQRRSGWGSKEKNQSLCQETCVFWEKTTSVMLIPNLVFLERKTAYLYDRRQIKET